jgi:hypothetical protein
VIELSSGIAFVAHQFGDFRESEESAGMVTQYKVIEDDKVEL